MQPIVAGAAASAAAVGIGAVAAKVAGEARAFSSGASWISQGGTPHGTLYAKWLGVRNVAKWGVKNLILHPRMTLTTYAAERDARMLENQLWHGGRTDFLTTAGKAKLKIGYDNGPDAFRHTYASALIVYRLMTKLGVSAEKAGAFLDGAGNAHERDSWLHAAKMVNLPPGVKGHNPQLHSRYSSEMDVHNNILGRALGAELAIEHIRRKGTSGALDAAAGERALQQTVLDAIAGTDALPTTRRAVVMDHVEAPPRPAVAADIYDLGPDGRLILGADGNPQLRQNPSDAPGYFAPIKPDHTVDLSMPRAQLDRESISWPRESTPQA